MSRWCRHDPRRHHRGRDCRAGLRQAVTAGLQPLLLDKGRGIGGRVATRRANGLHFDHGAQYVTAKGDQFTAALEGLVARGNAAPWANGTGRTQIVGTPSMSSIPKALAAGLDVRTGVQVTNVQRDGLRWKLRFGDTDHTFTHVVVTVPAPQVGDLLGADHPMAARIASVRFAPCLTLMAGIVGPAPFVSRREPDDPLAWISNNGSKPGRSRNEAIAWVAQAGLDFSSKHLEDGLPQISARMLPLLCDSLGVIPDKVIHVAAHRWRYARVTDPLGQPFLSTSDATLYLGGDWCLGARVEAAWTSGSALAEDLLEHLK